mgnify:CR=1 FL=1|nr:MAG TPA: hypothetical protein [Caudoviricetes sp.]
MTITIKGINSLSNKLNKLSNVKAKNSVKEVAKFVEKELRNEASKFSTRSELIGEVEEREYKNGNYYIEVGLKNSYESWEEWKHLYFHHYGYNQKIWGKDSNLYNKTHQFWFTNAIDNIDQKALKELKKKMQEEIRNALK